MLVLKVGGDLFKGKLHYFAVRATQPLTFPMANSILVKIGKTLGQGAC